MCDDSMVTMQQRGSGSNAANNITAMPDVAAVWLTCDAWQHRDGRAGMKPLTAPGDADKRITIGLLDLSLLRLP